MSFSWSFSVGDGAQTTLNTTDVFFGSDPNHLDPSDPADILYLANYSISGPTTPYPERLLQAVTYEGDNTIRMWFDGPLVPGEAYEITLSGIEDILGVPLTPLVFSFPAFGEDWRAISLEQEVRQSWDLRNPQAERDAPQGEPLGTFVIAGDGDLDIETQRQYLRKRIFRRLETRRGTILHLPDYGLLLADKTLYNATTLRQLQQEVESQISQEVDVVSVRASVRQLVAGVVYTRLSVRDRFGTFNIEGTIGGDS